VHTYSIKDSFIKWLSHSGSGSLFQEWWLSNTGQVAPESREYSHLLIGVERMCKVSQSGTHLAVGDSNMGVARYNLSVSLADV